MKNLRNILIVLFSAVLCLSFVLSLIDTNELPKSSDFNHNNIRTHVEKICETGPHSVFDKEENAAVQQYIISELEKLGIVNSDTTEVPAYQIQEFVDSPRRYKNFYLENIIVHIPANAETTTNQAVMTMAHFDSVPTGDGASDDAVACGTMLEAVRYYLDRMNNGYTISNDLVFCFVNGEEFGLLGSEAFMNEFDGFDNLIERINFAINLEARGTAGTQIMFETADNNYNTVKLFGEVNNNLFTCSIATMIYGMMPNGTDFSNLKTHYQGVNIANIGEGENYHTPNDSIGNVSEVCLSQQAQIINNLLDKLGRYNLDKLYEAEENAIFFSYLNIGDAVYNNTAAVVLAVIGILMLIANIVLSVIFKRKKLVKTLKSYLTIIIGLVLTAGITYGCYYLFQLTAALSGAIDFHMVGDVSYSNVAITVGIALLALGITALTAYFGCKLFRTESGDIIRAFSYIHISLGIVLTFVLPDASYLFVFSGILLMINELVITIRPDFEKYHCELLIEAIYLPVVIPIITIATSALGLGMAYVFGLLFALSIFGISACIAPVCGYFSVNFLVRKDKSKTAPGWVGAVHIIGSALVIFLCVSLCKPSPLATITDDGDFMTEDALIYAVHSDGEQTCYVYDLNAYNALKKYCPEMYYDEYEWGYVGKDENLTIPLSALSTADGHVINIKRSNEKSTVQLNFMDAQQVKSVTVDDGITARDYYLSDSGFLSITLHTDCTVTLNGGSADVYAIENIKDYPLIIPENYEENEKLHFNLWLQSWFEIR